MDWQTKDFHLRPKSPKHSFYKSITILGLFAFVLCLQVALRQEDQQQQSLGYKHPRNLSVTHQEKGSMYSGRKLLQTTDDPLPPYCQGDGYGKHEHVTWSTTYCCVVMLQKYETLQLVLEASLHLNDIPTFNSYGARWGIGW